MAAVKRASAKQGYTLQKVSIRQLYEKRVTREPSEKALRERALQGILVFIESVGNTRYYDLVLSAVRCNAARLCKRPGVQWTDITAVFDGSTGTNESIRALLDEGLSQEEVETAIAERLAALLKGRPKLG